MKETLWQRLFRGVRRIRQQPRWKQFAGPDWADRIMAVDATDRFHAKQGRTIARWSLEADGRRLVVYLKRHYRLPWWHGLLALVWPDGCWSPALAEWEHLTWARRHGLPVPEAVAGGEYIGPWGHFQSFIAIEELTGMLALHEAIPLAASRLDAVSFRRWKAGLVREMVAIVHELHRRHRFHKDLYLCHFYVAEEDTGRVPDWIGRVRIIDLHRLGRHRFTAGWRRAKDLAQLLYSSDVPGVTLRDRLHFWRHYLAAEPLGGVARWLRMCIRVQAWNYHRRSRRKQRKNAA
jgi:Lipopolysaccharide kinase (Kdo/WaaP) family